MRRIPDGQPVTDDDSGNFDVRGLRNRLDPELMDLVARVVKNAIREARPQVHYQPNGERALLKWLIGLATSLLVTAILGAILAWGSIHDLQATLQTWRDDTERRLDRIENRIDGRSGIARGEAVEPRTSP